MSRWCARRSSSSPLVRMCASKLCFFPSPSSISVLFLLFFWPSRSYFHKHFLMPAALKDKSFSLRRWRRWRRIAKRRIILHYFLPGNIPPRSILRLKGSRETSKFLLFFFDFVKFFIFPHNFFFALGNEVGVTGKNSLRCDHRRKRIKTFFFVLWPNFCCAPHASQQFPMILVAARISKSANRKYYNL